MLYRIVRTPVVSVGELDSGYIESGHKIDRPPRMCSRLGASARTVDQVRAVEAVTAREAGACRCGRR